MIETLREDLQNNQSHLPQEEHDLAQTNAELKQKLEDQIRESNETIQVRIFISFGVSFLCSLSLSRISRRDNRKWRSF